MKLLSLTTGKEVEIGMTLRAVSGVIVGHLIVVQGINEPSDLFPLGYIKHDMGNMGGIDSWKTLIPRVLDCVFIQDDSLVMSATYDNEESLGNTIIAILHKFQSDGRKVRKIFVGVREWDQIRDLEHVNRFYASSGVAPPTKFNNVLVERLPHREDCLAFEHGPLERGGNYQGSERASEVIEPPNCDHDCIKINATQEQCTYCEFVRPIQQGNSDGV